jgi:transcriptional regulator with XRE-family HTH domain
MPVGWLPKVAMLKSLHTHQNEILLLLLKRSRQVQRLRQSDLAVRLGRGQSMVSKIERGVRRLDVIELRAWLTALNVDFLAFMAELNSSLEGVPTVDPRFRSRRRRSPPHGFRSSGS